MELSQDNAERDSATAWRMTTELTAVSGGTVLFGIILAQLAPEGSSTDQERRIAYVFDAACFVYTCRRLINLSNDCRYFAGAVIISSFVLIPGLITACGVPERPEYCVQPHESKEVAEQKGAATDPDGFFGGWWKGIQLAFACRSYMILMFAFLASGLTFQLTSNNLNLCE